jgi:hypothetical protein
LDSTLEFTVGEASSCPGCATPQHYNGCHTSLGRRPFIPQVRARGAWVISKALSADGRLTCTFTLKAICLDKTNRLSKQALESGGTVFILWIRQLKFSILKCILQGYRI